MTEQEKQDAPAEEPAAGQLQAEASSDAGEAKAAEAKAPAKKEPGPAAPVGPDHAVVVAPQEPGTPIISRRRVLQVGFWASVGGIAAGAAACGLDLIYPTSVTGFGGTVAVNADDVPPPGGKAEIGEGRFWLVNLTAEQGGPGLLALWWKCPHLGCTVPWRPTFSFPDPVSGEPKLGWFRCPCHGSTYTDSGVRVFGPAPRSMDTMALTVDGGNIIVDTGNVTPGAPDNASRATRI